jgi:hypothetical protein
MTTKEWLENSLRPIDEDISIIRNGIVWKYVSGFSSYGCIFAICENDTNYCVHSGEDWKENEEPNLGYYQKPIQYNDLIIKIAITYDSIRANVLRR